MNALENELNILNSTYWGAPRTIFDAELKKVYDNKLDEIGETYWLHVQDFASVFKADPYDMYYIMENLPTAPKPYNCILGILATVYNLRETTVMQASITFDEIISFREEYDKTPNVAP